MMSEEKQDSPKITTVVKQKNPGRVEALKRLAAISKQDDGTNERKNG